LLHTLNVREIERKGFVLGYPTAMTECRAAALRKGVMKGA